MNNNKLQQPTTLQKVVNIIGTIFSIICLQFPQQIIHRHKK